MLDARLRKNMDFALLTIMALIVTLGIVTIYSATRDTTARYHVKQLVWFGLGCVAMGGMASVEYTRFTRLAKPLYITNLCLLLLVWRFAPKIKGSARWINIGSFQFQPSEFAKLILIICLAVYILHRLDTIRQLPTLLGSFLYIAVPTALIYKQPDLGTALVLLSIWFGMTYIAGARLRHLALFLVCGIALFSLLWKTGQIKPYQKNRILVFMNPEIDPKDAGWQVKQARIAIGSGQVWGKGIGQGTQVQGKFIPENHTDFIFTVVGEEGGFAVSAALVLLYTGLLWRGAVTILHAEDMLGRLLAAGIVSMYAFHVIVNIGMNIGILPMTGVPLPLFSYGGSSMILNMAAVGLLLGIGMRRNRLMF